jgi:Domain of Unknown Function (DUF1080)
MLSPIWKTSIKGIYTHFPSSFARLTLIRALKLLSMGIVFFSLLACTSNNTPQAMPSPTTQRVTPTSVPKERLLYQADWSRGLAEWQQASTGWKVKNGFIESDLSDTLSLLLPYKITVDTYAIEFSVQVVRVPKDGGQFQLVADQQPGKDGYTADILQLLAPGNHAFSVHSNTEVVIEPQEAMEEALPLIKDYEPGGQYRLYRIEVKGSRVDFKVDGHLVSRAIGDQTATLSNGPIHFFSHAAILRLSSFRVLTY